MTLLAILAATLAGLGWLAWWCGRRAWAQLHATVTAMPADPVLPVDLWPVGIDTSSAWPYRRGAALAARLLSGRR